MKDSPPVKSSGTPMGSSKIILGGGGYLHKSMTTNKNGGQKANRRPDPYYNDENEFIDDSNDDQYYETIESDESGAGNSESDEDYEAGLYRNNNNKLPVELRKTNRTYLRYKIKNSNSNKMMIDRTQETNGLDDLNDSKFF